MKEKLKIEPLPVTQLPMKDYIKQMKLKYEQLRRTKMVEKNSKGIQETVDVLEFAKDLVNIVGAVTAENSASGKKVALTEYPAFFPLVFKVSPLVSGIAEVPAELLDTITVEEKEKIKAVVKQVNAISENADLDEAVEDFLEWALATKHLVQKYIVKS